jgi:hypothetical protein
MVSRADISGMPTDVLITNLIEVHIRLFRIYNGMKKMSTVNLGVVKPK